MQQCSKDVEHDRSKYTTLLDTTMDKKFLDLEQLNYTTAFMFVGKTIVIANKFLVYLRC